LKGLEEGIEKNDNQIEEAQAQIGRIWWVAERLVGKEAGRGADPKDPTKAAKKIAEYLSNAMRLGWLEQIGPIFDEQLFGLGCRETVCA